MRLYAPLVVAAALATSLQAHAATTWTAYIYNSAITTTAAQGFKRICESIEKETDGELKIQMHLGGSLPIKTTDITQAVGERIVDFGADGFFLGAVTIGGVLRLPMLIDTIEQMQTAEEIMQPYLERGFKQKGAIVLGHYTYPAQVLWANQPLTSLADISGKKIRVTSPEQSEFIKRMGGIGVTIGAPEVPSSLERGVVDGVITASAGGGRIWSDLLTHNYRLGLNFFNSMILVNDEAWSELDPAVQEKVREIVQREMPKITAQMFAEEEEITEQLAAKGMVVTRPTAEEIAAAREKVASFWDEWASSHGSEHQEALAKVRAAIGR